VSYKKQELPNIRQHLVVAVLEIVESVMLIFLAFCVVIFALLDFEEIVFTNYLSLYLAASIK
jgi:hypothetical protein